MMNLPHLPLFRHFCAKVLCSAMLFISLLSNTETPFYYKYSVILISEKSYLSKESQVGIYTKVNLPEKQSALKRQAYYHCIGNTDHFFSTAILGGSSHFKEHYQITNHTLKVFLKGYVSKQKLKGLNHESFKLLMITVSHFSRPPPVFPDILSIREYRWQQ
ncbi:hypothetical protein SAMN05421856_101129 [Chryseobacterium taichungense]|uniref:Uncharacterized protein n=1 Tax=Chryseobacterium taichungense TaxID=295069 RepID=A0A1H7VNP8_9FLAO|nr:hypothetical protein [Chryseobacterium taichungense]SEM10654.1 hypothetical protein SAMN05421856_101129 [Chryseobacterium taichungense]